ncbi:hypothetical protein [Microvirga terricola]|uniref:Uncharacterized protein n=1 Tax=Microvirga terricola TaxID=2719797 RepID=A0ABX0V9D5_9HYPH|nr:hypothetical protein [Microvirga terricola]NIX75814.1 hypothetical protein [Microvirga terricola]
MTHSLDAVTAMGPQMHSEHAFTANNGREHGASLKKQGFRVIPSSARSSRTNSFIFGRSDSRIRPLLNQEERDRLHCWAMIVALASSAAGTTLLITAALR